MIRPQGDNATDSVNLISGTTSVIDVTETTSKHTGRYSYGDLILWTLVDGPKRYIHRSSASFIHRFEKNKRRFTLQQVIASRQQKIYEQQCEIEELRRRIREVCGDNKFLREQNYWQGKTLEKLDGRHAELPQIINSHLEEVRVYREQLKRVREVLKIEKQRRHDAEAEKDKRYCELKHLRRVAKEQKLLEKEELVATIEKLRNEAGEHEKQLSNLGRYADNLEKNQRCESMRSSRTHKEMKATCQRLLDRIQDLEQIIEEKQKIIELSNIYTKHYTRGQVSNASTEQLTSKTMGSVEAVGHTRSGERHASESYRIRERIKKFDLRRQEMAKKREKTRKQHVHHENDCSYRGDDGDVKYDDDDDGDENSFLDSVFALSPCEVVSRPIEMLHPMHAQKADQNIMIGLGCTDENNKNEQRREHASIILPKICASDDNQKTEVIIKRPNSPQQIRTYDKQASLFRAVRASQEHSRRLAEAHIHTIRCKATTNLPYPTDRTPSQPSEAWVLHQKDDKMHEQKAAFDRLIQNIEGNKEIPGEHIVETASSLSESSQPANQSDQTSVSPAKSAALVHTASPLVPQTTSDLSTFDSFELTPLSNSMMHICRPCGDQDIDYYMPGDTPTPTSDMSPREGSSEVDTEVERDQEESVVCPAGDDGLTQTDAPQVSELDSLDVVNPNSADNHLEADRKEQEKSVSTAENEVNQLEHASMAKKTRGLNLNSKQASRTTTLYAVIKKKLTSVGQTAVL